jgi:hypothetical protein
MKKHSIRSSTTNRQVFDLGKDLQTFSVRYRQACCPGPLEEFAPNEPRPGRLNVTFSKPGERTVFYHTCPILSNTVYHCESDGRIVAYATQTSSILNLQARRLSEALGALSQLTQSLGRYRGYLPWPPILLVEDFFQSSCHPNASQLSSQMLCSLAERVKVESR